MELEFTVPGEPKGKGRPRFATYTGRAYTPEGTVDYQNAVRLEYYRQCEASRH